MSILQLMQIPQSQRDIRWLKRMLQSAIELELSTIPVYLIGMWSIIDPDDDVRADLFEIVLQEMLHMGLACNMLTTIGGFPKLVSAAPAYPGPLPGGVRPELRVFLQGFSRAMVRAVYMEIEYPEHGPITKFMGVKYPTIGAFYDAISKKFKSLPAQAFTKQRQLEIPGFGLVRIDSKKDALDQIELIKEQGEGTSQDPYPASDPDDRAHYYRFAELYYGRKLVKKKGKWIYAGKKIPLPACYPVPEIPEEGYGPKTKDFNTIYGSVLWYLESAWSKKDGAADLQSARDLMSQLGPAARILMAMPLPDGSGVYGPDFKIPARRSSS